MRRTVSMSRIDDPRNVRLRHGATTPLCEDTKNYCLQPLRVRNVEHYMSAFPRCQEETGAVRVSVAPATHPEHDRRSAEIEFLSQLVLQITFVREVEVHGMVDGQDEGRGINANLGGEKQLHGVASLGRLRGVGRGGPAEEPVQRTRRDAGPAGGMR